MIGTDLKRTSFDAQIVDKCTKLNPKMRFGGKVSVTDLNKGRLMTIDDAANYLAVSKSTLYALVSKGEIRTVKFGCGPKAKGITRFRQEDLERFITKKLSKP